MYIAGAIGGRGEFTMDTDKYLYPINDNMERNFESHLSHYISYWEGESLSGLPLQSATDGEAHIVFIYHSDHLGSGTAISSEGAIIHHTLSYLPFGETLMDIKDPYQTPYDLSTSYQFTGHEKDEETGLTYAHARYYDSELAIWLSVDPLAEAKPWMSSYNYCSNNPVNRMDPDGKDDWEVNQKGQVNYRYDLPKSEIHTLYKVDNKGNRTGKSIILKDRTILDQLSVSKGIANDYDSEGNILRSGDRRVAIQEDTSSEDIIKTFLFMANNTSVEWTIIFAKENNSYKYGLATSGFDDYVSGMFNENSIITNIHSHPKRKTKEDELDSMHGDRINSQKRSYNQYVYMPHSTRLYNVNKGEIIYIRQINGDHNRFVNIKK